LLRNERSSTLNPLTHGHTDVIDISVVVNLFLFTGMSGAAANSTFCDLRHAGGYNYAYVKKILVCTHHIIQPF
jgi:hypothetical protein